LKVKKRFEKFQSVGAAAGSEEIAKRKAVSQYMTVIPWDTSKGKRQGIFILVELVPSLESLRSNTQDDGHWWEAVTNTIFGIIFLQTLQG
jgi:hypothetical protein